MKSKELTILLEDFKEHRSKKEYNYKIEGDLDLLSEYVDITDMFKTFLEIKDLKIKYKVYALNEDGYDELLDLGFPKKKIIKNYVEY